MHKGILGKDYVTLKGRGGRDTQNGSTVKSDKFMHLSVDIGASTICGRIPDSFLMTYSDVDIDCPECIKKLLASHQPSLILKEEKMTDELREKLADYFAHLGYTTLEQSRGLVGEFIFYKQADQIISLIKESVKEPPVLSDEDLAISWLAAEQSMGFLNNCIVDEILRDKEIYSIGDITHGKFTSQAQRDADMRYWNGNQS